MFVGICNLEKVEKRKLLKSKLKEEETIVAKFLNYDLKLKYGSTTGNKDIYLTDKNRIVIYDDGGSFSEEKIYASDIYGLGKYDFNRGYEIFLDFPYSVSISLHLSLTDLVLYNEYFYKYLNFSKEPTILITKEENIPLKNLALTKEDILFYNGEDDITKVQLDKIKDLKYGNRVLNISYDINGIINKIYVFNLDFEPVKSIKILLERQMQK